MHLSRHAKRCSYMSLQNAHTSHGLGLLDFSIPKFELLHILQLAVTKTILTISSIPGVLTFIFGKRCKILNMNEATGGHHGIGKTDVLYAH